MKKLLIIALMLMATSSLASPSIGLYADTGATTRFAGINPYVPLNLYVIAIWPTESPLNGGITAAEFKIDNLPANLNYPWGTVTTHHTTDLVIGDLWTDYSAAWSTPQGAGAGMFEIARVEFLMFDPSWIPAGHVSTIAPGDDCDCLVLVDNLFEIYTAVGLPFYFSAVAADETSWSEIKSLY